MSLKLKGLQITSFGTTLYNPTLCVIDMQNDFINGALGTDEAQSIVFKVYNKIYNYIQNVNDHVYFTKDEHQKGEGYYNSEEGKHLPVPHCIFNTKGWEIQQDILDLINNSKNIFVKNQFGCPELVNAIPKDTDGIIIIGLCTDICVISNALLLKTYFPNIPIYIDAACCAGTTPENHDKALDIMKQCHINILNKGEESWRKNKKEEG